MIFIHLSKKSLVVAWRVARGALAARYFSTFFFLTARIVQLLANGVGAKFVHRCDGLQWGNPFKCSDTESQHVPLIANTLPPLCPGCTQSRTAPMHLRWKVVKWNAIVIGRTWKWENLFLDPILSPWPMRRCIQLTLSASLFCASRTRKRWTLILSVAIRLVYRKDPSGHVQHLLSLSLSLSLSGFDVAWEWMRTPSSRSNL